MKNWQNIYSIRKQRGKTYYTLIEIKVISDLTGVLHIFYSKFSTRSSIVIIDTLKIRNIWM